MFLLKKIVASFLLPVPISVFLVLVGLFFLWFTRRQKTGKVFVTIAFLVLTFFSNGGVSDLFMRPLEQKYPPVTDVKAIKDVKWIVVLGGGSIFDPKLPVSTYLSEASLTRVSEAIRIHNRLPKTRLIFSGRSYFEGIRPVAEVMAQVALELGIQPGEIVIEAEAAETKDHPIYVKKLVGMDQFILVTSAVHMPRAMALFRKHGMYPIPAPTNYKAIQKEGFNFTGLFPSANPLAKSAQAIHEYLGMLWAKLRAQI